jgi:uncharacterized membrane protein
VPFFVLETTEVRIMAKVEKTITIKAPVEKVFSFIKPTNLPEIWPSLVETKDVQQLPNGGYSNRWVYKMAGIRLEGSSEDIEYVTNERVVSRTKGGVESTQTWIFQPDAGGTKVTFNVEYTIPIPVLGKLAEAIIVKMNEHEAELLLANLKTRIEA